MKVIPCFWTQFPLPSTLHVLGLFIIYTVNALVAIREGLIQFVAEKSLFKNLLLFWGKVGWC